MAINNTTLTGRLTKDVEVRYTGSGIAVGNFTLAVERNFKNANGERETDFINCVIWRQSAETLASFASKGSLIGIVGGIQTGSYDNNEGRTIYTTEVNVDNFEMLEPKEVNEERKNNSKVSNTENRYTSNSNQEKKSVASTFDTNKDKFTTFDSENPFEKSGGDVTDISDDDLPF